MSRRQKTLKVNIPYRGSAGPLHLLIDSTGIKVEDEGEWNARKHGGTKRRIWRKIHIGIDEQTLEIRAAELTTSDVGDAPMLPELLDQIPPDQEIASVTADGGRARSAIPPRFSRSTRRQPAMRIRPFRHRQVRIGAHAFAPLAQNILGPIKSEVKVVRQVIAIRG